MESTGQRVVAVSELRSELSASGGLRGVIAFQNDVNTLIAAVARLDTVQEGTGFADVQAQFGLLPLAPVRPGERRNLAQARAALRSLVISGQERYRRLLESR